MTAKVFTDEIAPFIATDNPEALIKKAEEIGKEIARTLNTTQLRNIFGMIRQIYLTWSIDPERSYRQAVLLRPKMGYYSKRVAERAEEGMQLFTEALDIALESMMAANTLEEKQERYNRVAEFAEAMVAYHKKHEDRKSYSKK